MSPGAVIRALAGAVGMALALGPAPAMAQPAATPPAATLSEEADRLLRERSGVLAAAPSLALDVTILREVEMADGRIAPCSRT
jgi:hypothetical protein